eukprot:COSAG04_NODE_838_length_9963_cov_6.375912_5_plen_229_part_00
MIPAEQVERALEVVWAAGSKPPSIVRGRPETYGTPEARESGWSARDIATELMDFLPGPVGESAVWAAAEQLLGPELIRPDATLDARPTSSGGARACGRRPRGVYNTLPTDGLEKPADFWPGGCHQEGHPFQLGVVGCVDRIVPDGGTCSRSLLVFFRGKPPLKEAALRRRLPRLAALAPPALEEGPARVLHRRRRHQRRRPRHRPGRGQPRQQRGRGRGGGRVQRGGV